MRSIRFQLRRQHKLPGRPNVGQILKCAVKRFNSWLPPLNWNVWISATIVSFMKCYWWKLCFWGFWRDFNCKYGRKSVFFLLPPTAVHTSPHISRGKGGALKEYSWLPPLNCNVSMWATIVSCMKCYWWKLCFWGFWLDFNCKYEKNRYFSITSNSSSYLMTEASVIYHVEKEEFSVSCFSAIFPAQFEYEAPVCGNTTSEV